VKAQEFIGDTSGAVRNRRAKVDAWLINLRAVVRVARQEVPALQGQGLSDIRISGDAQEQRVTLVFRKPS
jgi:hypothetical protein